SPPSSPPPSPSPPRATAPAPASSAHLSPASTPTTRSPLRCSPARSKSPRRARRSSSAPITPPPAATRSSRRSRAPTSGAFTRSRSARRPLQIRTSPAAATAASLHARSEVRTMADFTLFLGNKTYSSWSLRGWLALKQAQVPFDEVVFPMDGPGHVTKAIQDKSPSGRVPLLQHGDLMVWDSIAIGEYVAELFPSAGLWPDDRRARAVARAASAEMHSGFAALRTAMPMNVRRAPIELAVGNDVKDDIARIT